MSVKASKIQELLFGKVAVQIDSLLSGHGFKYQKSKKRFYRQAGKLDQVFHLYTISSPLIYDDTEDKLVLRFILAASVEMPVFDKWYKETTSEPCLFTHRLSGGWLKIQAPISFEDFTGDDFYTPTDSQRFKRQVSSLLSAGSTADKEYISLEYWLSEKLPELLNAFDEETDVKKIFELREYPQSMLHTLFLHFNGFTELAREQYDVNVKKGIAMLEEKIKTGNTEDIRSYSKGLNTLITVAKKTGVAVYENPFDQAIKQVTAQQTKYEFAPEVIFSEMKRFDITRLDIQALQVNSLGEILILSELKRVLKLGKDGSVLLDMTIDAPAGFDQLTWTKTSLLPGTNDFFVNNFIFREDNSILELRLPRNSEKKSKHLQNFHIYSLTYSTEKGKYYLLYQDNFITYDQAGNESSIIPVKATSNGKIIPENEWLILQHGKNGYGIFNFSGQLISEHEVSGGNHEFELSPDYSYLAFFFYSTKSQLYNLANGKKQTLWAHPTFIKGYVETMYNDINHNFGMTRAKFSPDSKYLIGGGDHGKYVAFTMPKAERVELIPDPEFIKLLSPDTNRIFINTDGTVADHQEIKPGIVELDKQRFFVNRGNDITKILYFDNGDFFLTELGASNYVLAWDRQFNNRSYHKLNGAIDLHGNILSLCTGAELILYIRE